MASSDYIHINDRLAIFPRSDRAGVFHLRARLKGRAGYLYRSTDKYTEQEAREAAYEIFFKLQSQQDQGVVVGSTAFRGVYKLFQQDVLPHKSDSRRAQFEGTFDRYFLPFFKDTALQSINEVKVRSYWEFRINYYASAEVAERRQKAAKGKRGPKPKAKPTRRRTTLGNVKKPSAATLRVERGLLSEFLKYAHSKGLINRVPNLDVPTGLGYLKGEYGRRDHFTREEMRKLRDHLRKSTNEKAETALKKNNGRFSKAQKGQKRPHRLHLYQREVLRELVLILANTGLRIGEALKLKWGDLKQRKMRDGYEYFYITVRVGKTGSREVIPMKDAATYFLRLKKVCAKAEADDFIFQNADGSQLREPGVTFKKVLAELNMLTGPDGNRRSLYSLRHTYITNQLELGDLTIYQIAQNVGTSVQYIEKHYSHASIHKKAALYAEKGFETTKADADMKALFAR
jgi:integrase